MSTTQEWHLRARNPANPVVFFGKLTTMTACPQVAARRPRPAPTRPKSSGLADVTIGGTPAGRVQIELFADVVPKTAENVRQFFTGEYRYL